MAETTGDLSTETGVTWQLRDFLRIPANVGSRLESPSFSLAGADWKLNLYPNGQGLKYSKGCLDIYLSRSNYSVAQQRVKATLSLKNRDEKNCKSCSINHLYQLNDDSKGEVAFTTRSELEEKTRSLLPDGTLTVHCQIRVEPSSGDNGASKDESSENERVETGAVKCQHQDASKRTELPDACKGAVDLPRTSASVQYLKTDSKTFSESKEADESLKVARK